MDRNDWLSRRAKLEGIIDYHNRLILDQMMRLNYEGLEEIKNERARFEQELEDIDRSYR